MICFHCGREYRQVYRGGRLRNIDSKTDREHWRDCGQRATKKAVSPKRPRPKRPMKKRVNHIVGKTTGPTIIARCADCKSPPWEPCRCWPDADSDDKVNAEADERMKFRILEEV